VTAVTPQHYRVGIEIWTEQEDIRNLSYNLRMVYRHRATDNVGARLRANNSAAPDDLGSSTSTGCKITRANTEKDNLGGHHTDNLFEGNRNTRSCESRLQNRISIVSKGKVQRNNITSQKSLYYCRQFVGPR